MIVRDLEVAARREFDLIVVGGGIYGVSVLREAARRGLSACLCEADDFGGATSWNSLRIVHGGLRYLQTLDLGRFLRSVSARREVAAQLPSLVRPLGCAMPLYGSGLKRSSVMRLALFANDALSLGRNAGLPEALRLPSGYVLDAQSARRAFPLVRADGLKGAAIWSDYMMVSSERILIELLHDACKHGALALNYASVQGVSADGTVVAGVRARDELTGREFDIAAQTVVNCTGPWARRLAHGPGGESGRLFHPSLAFNLLLDIDLETDCALAVAPPATEVPVLFLVPQRDGLLAGTQHLPRPPDTVDSVPTEAEVDDFLALLNRAVPALGARSGNVRQVLAGLLPVTAPGTTDLLRREIFQDHGAAGGVKGVYSVSGVKYTTAGAVACEMLDRMGYRAGPGAGRGKLAISSATPILTDVGRLENLDAGEGASLLVQLIADESVQCLDDLVLRRTNWALSAADFPALRKMVANWTGLRESHGRSTGS